MWKIKLNGGCKLVNVQIKSEASKAKWMMEMATKPEFRVNLKIFSDLAESADQTDSEKIDKLFELDHQKTKILIFPKDMSKCS